MELDCPVPRAVRCQRQQRALRSVRKRYFALEGALPGAMEVLKACGAVDYFCQHGHGLISKKRVEFIPLVYVSGRVFSPSQSASLHFLSSRLPDVWLAFHPL